MIDLSHVNAWVFDMDDTLYPREQGLMRLVQARINAFVVEAVGLEPEAAAAMHVPCTGCCAASPRWVL